MRDNALFFINSLKIIVSAKRYVITHLIPAAFITLLCWNFALLRGNICWWRYHYFRGQWTQKTVWSFLLSHSERLV